jgi:hypothetical protein
MSKKISASQVNSIQNRLNTLIELAPSLVPTKAAIVGLGDVILVASTAGAAIPVVVLSILARLIERFIENFRVNKEEEARKIQSRLAAMRDVLNGLPPCVEEGGVDGLRITDEVINYIAEEGFRIANTTGQIANIGNADFGFLNGLANLPTTIVRTVIRAITDSVTDRFSQSTGNVNRQFETELQAISKIVKGLGVCKSADPKPPEEEPEPEPEPPPDEGEEPEPPDEDEDEEPEPDEDEEPTDPPADTEECGRLIAALEAIGSLEGGDQTDLTERLDELEKLIRDLAENVAQMRTEQQQNARRDDDFSRNIITAVYTGQTFALQNAQRSDQLVRDTQLLIDAVREDIKDTINTLQQLLLITLLGIAGGIGGLYAVLAAMSAAITAAFGVLAKGIAAGFAATNGLLVRLTPVLGRILSELIDLDFEVDEVQRQLRKIDDDIDDIEDDVEDIAKALDVDLEGTLVALDWVPIEDLEEGTLRQKALDDEVTPTNELDSDEVELEEVEIDYKGRAFRGVESMLEGISKQLNILAADVKGSSDDAAFSLPDSYKLKRESLFPQMMLNFYGVDEDGKINRVTKGRMTVPYYNFPEFGMPEEPIIPRYKKGSYQGELTLYKDVEINDQFIREYFAPILVYCESPDECERVLGILADYVNPDYEARDTKITISKIIKVDKTGKELPDLIESDMIAFDAEWFPGGTYSTFVRGEARQRQRERRVKYLSRNQKTV